jgi:pimeloyl-ACP methyl ester carboxylesterase
VYNVDVAARDEVLTLASGRRIGYRLYGADTTPKLLYLHGRPGSRAEIGLYDEDLLVERDLCAVALDRPGYGLTDPLDALGPLSRVQDSLELLNYLDLSDVTVQGTSGGGVPALATGVVARDRARAIVLTGCGVLNDPEGTFDGYPTDYLEELLREHNDKAGARRDAENFANALREDPIATWQGLTAHWPQNERGFIEAKPEMVVEDSLQAITHGGLGYFVDNMSSWQPWPQQFDDIDLPVHAFHGESDHWAPIALVRKALAPIQNLRWTTYDGDHLSPFATRDRQAAMLDIAC